MLSSVENEMENGEWRMENERIPINLLNFQFSDFSLAKSQSQAFLPLF